MTYVISDLHGMYADYCAMLKKIRFCSEDRLYILGDICDRGPDTVPLYMDIMARENVYCIRGNHEEMLLAALPQTFGYLKKMCDFSAMTGLYDTESWCACGGDTTRLALFFCEQKTVEEIYSYISDMPYYRSITVGNTEYIMVHAGLDEFSPEKPLGDYSSEDLVWSRPDFDQRLWPDERKKLIVGHTPTFAFREDRTAEIYHGKGDIIVVDCGAVFKETGGRLGCLCLETMKEYYI